MKDLFGEEYIMPGDEKVKPSGPAKPGSGWPAQLHGTTPLHLHRTDGPDTSIEAAYSVDTTKLERMVLDAIRSFGPDGCISDDVRALPQFADYPYSSVTARYRALLDRGHIVDTGERRKGNSGRGMRVMVAQEFNTGGAMDES